MSTDYEEFDIEIDILHALEDFLDAYDNHAEMVVTEAIANAIDVRATEISIELKTNIDDEGTVSFHNNGPAMTAGQFKNYHVIARSSKSKGTGIGFAGIGAKVYLAAWDQTRIHTETKDESTALSSDMFVRNNILRAKCLKPTLTKNGTLYSVILKRDDYAYLEKSMLYVILDTFNPAISSGLKVTLNGENIRPWKPSSKFKKTITVTIKEKKFPVAIMVTDEDIDDKKTYMNYHVSGKIITTRKPEWIPEVKPEYAKRILAYVDAIAISDQLNLSKTGFKTGSSHATGPVFKEIDKRIFDLLNKNGYIGEQSLRKFESNSLTKFFEKIFKDPRYSFLNPGAIGGIGPGQGPGTGGTPPKGGEKKPRPGNPGGNQKPRGGGSLSIGWVQRPNDTREGWLDPSTNKIIINMEHPLFIKYEKNQSARNQRVGTIMTSVLIKNATTKKAMDTVEAFDLQSKLLTMAKDAMW